MTPKDRVRAALERKPPDRPPVFEYFWPQWEDRWHVEKGFATWEDIEARGRGAHDFDRPSLDDWRYPWEHDIYDYYDIDLRLITANYAPRIGDPEILEETTESYILRDGWGVIRKRLKSTQSSNVPDHFLESPIRSEADLDRYEFDPPDDRRRFAAWGRECAKHREVPFFVNLWGPFATYFGVCGMEQSFMDVLDRPSFVRKVVIRFIDYLIEVGRAQAAYAAEVGNPVLGAWIFEDVAYNQGMLISPQVYRDTCLMGLKRLVNGLREAGIPYMIFHSDGDFRKIIPFVIESRMDAIQPLEVRAGMDVVELNAQYGQELCFIGNIDNTGTLAKGPKQAIRQEVLRKLPIGRNGGYIIGSSHSIGMDVPTENYEYFRDLVRKFP